MFHIRTSDIELLALYYVYTYIPGESDTVLPEREDPEMHKYMYNNAIAGIKDHTL